MQQEIKEHGLPQFKVVSIPARREEEDADQSCDQSCHLGVNDDQISQCGRDLTFSRVILQYEEINLSQPE
jgi:hypothetical protein